MKDDPVPVVFRCIARHARLPIRCGRLLLFLAAVGLARVAGAESAALAPGEVRTVWTWDALWARDPAAATVVSQIVAEAAVTGSVALIEHTGARDWAWKPEGRIPVRAGDCLSLRARVQASGKGHAMIGFVLRHADGSPAAWCEGLVQTPGDGRWRLLESRILVPPEITEVEPRLIGDGPATIRMTGFSLASEGNIARLQSNAPAELAISNRMIALRFRPSIAAFAVTDLRTGREWTQPAVSCEVAVLSAVRDGAQGLKLVLLDVPSGHHLPVTVRLEPEAAEAVLTLDGARDMQMSESLTWPMPFTGGGDARLIVPLNEGIAYPVTDPAVQPMRLVGYGGHGICMSFWGVQSGDAGQMTILETADDATLRIERREGLLTGAVAWDAEKGQFGYARTLRYVFFDQGGYVAMAKRYRAFVQARGTFKTLAEKRRANPDVDRLIGAANIWFWEPDPLGMVSELRTAGLTNLLWSQATAPAVIEAMNRIGVLTSRYDIYQDLMDPANFPRLRYIHGDWTTAGWTNDLVRDASGDWERGWAIEAKDGPMVSCGVLCDTRAPDYARARIAAELTNHAYRCRFIDTTTAAPWRECYDPRHPMTRRDSRVAKMALLDLVSGRFRQVCGSETGHDAAVPYVHYFEGMMSLGPYRVPDAGRDMMRVWTHVPPDVARFQLGHRYRLPLWELVYHDCVVAHWYWGDYNNKLPALWDKRDLFNRLYGTPPMYMFGRAQWTQRRDRFVQSYRASTPVARATGYAEMLAHCALTPDRDVQQTRFANGVTVTVNFGDTPRTIAPGVVLAPGASRVEGVPGA